ncbi:uncharacterized protein [Apostichopus japonicus]|uniref:uncharacterized protein isoform X1 n=1 Tax=Stichopus japonicus TaxID=307972 RepID=UPI003AB8B925
MVTSKILWIIFILQVGFVLQAVTDEDVCMVKSLHGAVIISITPPSAYYQPNTGRNYCWILELPQNSNGDILISITNLSLSEISSGMCNDTLRITEVCGNMNNAEVMEKMCSCSGNCNSLISWRASPGCDLRVRLAKGNEWGRDRQRFGFEVKFSLESDPLVPNAPLSTTNAATSSKSFSYESDPLVSNTPSPTTNAPKLSTSLKVLVAILVLLIMILVVALSVAYFIRYNRRRKSDDKVASNTTFNNAAYSQNDVITSESHVESQLSDRNVRTETVNETPEISHSERLQGDNVEYNPLYIAGNEPNTQGQVDNVAYQSVDEANQNPHEYTYIDLEGKQEGHKNANQGQTSHVANVTDGNDSSNPVKPPDESKYLYIY